MKTKANKRQDLLNQDTGNLDAHFYEEGHRGILDISVKIIDKTNANEPTNREGFWAYKLKSFVPNVYIHIYIYIYMS